MVGYASQELKPGPTSGCQTPGLSRSLPPPPHICYINGGGGEPRVEPGVWCPEMWAQELERPKGRSYYLDSLSRPKMRTSDTDRCIL
jgi:hypothetical protein